MTAKTLRGYEYWGGTPLDARKYIRDEDNLPLSPVFKGCIPLYDWLRENGWKQVNNRNYQLGTYEKRIEE